MSQAKTSTKPSFRFLLSCTLLKCYCVFRGGIGDICKTGCKNYTITEKNGVGNISQSSIINQIVVGVLFHCMTRMHSYRQRWDLFWDSLYRNELPAIKNPVPNYNFCYERVCKNLSLITLPIRWDLFQERKKKDNTGCKEGKKN